MTGQLHSDLVLASIEVQRKKIKVYLFICEREEEIERANDREGQKERERVFQTAAQCLMLDLIPQP